MRLINRTRYPTREVERIVRSALGRRLLAFTTDSTGRPLVRDWLTVDVRSAPYVGAGGKRTAARAHEPSRDMTRRTWRVEASIGRRTDYPIEFNSHGTGFVELRSWQEDLFHQVAHEAWHVEHGPGERSANSVSDRRLVWFRLRRVVGLV